MTVFVLQVNLKVSLLCDEPAPGTFFCFFENPRPLKNGIGEGTL